MEETDSASEERTWEDHAETGDNPGNGKALVDKQDVPAETAAEKKARALGACIEQRVAYVKCLRKGLFADCSKSEKELWDCYAGQRGVDGSKKFALFGYSRKD